MFWPSRSLQEYSKHPLSVSDLFLWSQLHSFAQSLHPTYSVYTCEPFCAERCLLKISPFFFFTRIHQGLTIFIPSFHTPLSYYPCPATSLFPTLPSTSPISSTLLPPSIFSWQSFTSLQHSLTSSRPFPFITFTGTYPQTHACFTIPSFPVVQTTLDPSRCVTLYLFLP